MTTDSSGKVKRPWYRKKRFLIPMILVLIIAIGGFILYSNFNRLLSDALHKSFDKSLVSDVYELKFEKLNVDFIGGNISVTNVTMQPLEKPLKNYPYINSSYILTTNK